MAVNNAPVDMFIKEKKSRGKPLKLLIPVAYHLSLFLKMIWKFLIIVQSIWTLQLVSE